PTLSRVGVGLHCAKLELHDMQRCQTCMHARALIFFLLSVVSAVACTAETSSVERGREAIDEFGCAVCHRVPGVASAGGGIGPSLANVTRRSYLAGALPNQRDTMARFIEHPQQLRPGTAMP